MMQEGDRTSTVAPDPLAPFLMVRSGGHRN